MDKIMDNINFSVIMPTYNQAGFIRRAIVSLCKQTYKNWELIIINDGSTDKTEEYLSAYLSSSDYSIKYIRNKTNKGLGAAINKGLDIAKYDYIAYLASDDYFDSDHLGNFKEVFDKSENTVLAFSGFRYDKTNDSARLDYGETNGVRPDYCLILTQTAHKKTEDRWIEREEYVSDDLFFTFWRKLTDKGSFVPTKKISCLWNNHPNQRHKILSERFGGGINKYRRFYRVQHPIKFRATNYKTIDENTIYMPYRKKYPLNENSLKILLVGELAYNPERVYAFEEAGHKLYGLWCRPTFCFSTVGPLPFGNVEDISNHNWRERIKEIQPDIIYAMLSTGAIPLAHEVMKANTGIPFVWHFKEVPHEAMKVGLWNQLIELYSYADGKIYLNEDVKNWFDQFTPAIHPDITYILDGDYPKNNCYTNDFSTKLSNLDGATHTVVVGRMIGVNTADMMTLAKNNIHLHLYNENYISEKEKMTPYRKVAPNHFHVHPHCSQLKWVQEFSKYDAGWLHSFNSNNKGDLLKANWSDLNLPARINTLAAAGLPVIQKKNEGHIVAMRNYIKQRNVGIFYDNMNELVEQLKNKELLTSLTENILKQRPSFTFDYHLPELIEFFRKIIDRKRNNK
jgi:glycosyltransferase involved in cell wall biosynthesis